MDIQLTLHGILRDHLPRQAKGKTTLSLPENCTIADVISLLKIKQTCSAAVNGNQVKADYTLHPGDDLHLFRMIGGG